MSNATKCDRCGACYEYGGMTVGEEYDLCDGCVADFEAWMERGQMADASEGIVMARVFGVDDTREQLEADVRKFAQVYYADHLLVHDKVIELLDRQAAITERKYRDEWKGLAEKYRADSIAAQEETERYRVKLGDVLDALHEAERAAR